jgi:hypothetical protein
MNRQVSALGILEGQVEFAGTKQRISRCFHFKLWWRDNITTVNLSSEIERSSPFFTQVEILGANTT